MRRQRGAAFIITLFALTTLVAMIVSLAATQNLVIQAQTARMEKRRARLAAEGGIQRAVEILAEKISSASSSSTTGGTTSGPSSGTSSPTGSNASTSAFTLSDDWATLGNSGADKFVVGSTSFRIQIVDEASLVDINTATDVQFQKMPLSQAQIDAILDWRDPATTSTLPDGAKDDYYNNLTNPYNTALRRFETLDELLLVRYVTALDVFELPQNQTSVTSTTLPNLPDGRTPTLADILCVNSKSPQTTSTGANRINVNTTDVATLIQRGFTAADAARLRPAPPAPPRTYTTLGQVLAVPGLSQAALALVLDNLTTDATPTKEGKINLNTATETVLNTVPNLPADAAAAIVTRQSSGFNALSDMLSIPGLNSPSVLSQIADAFTVSSQTFLIRVIGHAGATDFALEAEVDISSGTPKITRITEQPYPDMPTRWGWTDSGSNQIVLKEAA